MIEIVKPNINIDFLGKKRIFFFLSTCAVVASLAVMVANVFIKGDPVNYGTDFKGGSQIHVEFARPVNDAQVRGALEKAGFKGATVVKVNDDLHQNFFLLRLAEVSAFSPAEQAKIEGELKKIFKEDFLNLDYQRGGDKVYVNFKRESATDDLEETPSVKKTPVTEAPASAPAVDDLAEKTAADKAGDKPEEKVADKAGDKPEEKVADKTGDKPEGKDASEPPAATPNLQDLKNTRDASLVAMTQKIEQAFSTGQIAIQQIQRFGKLENRTFEVTLAGLDSDIRKIFEASLGAGVVKDVPQVEAVGAKMGKQLRDSGIKSVLYSLLLILIYVAFRFDFRYAPGGVVALFHDIIITMGVLAITWREFSMTTVAALLTIAGYSINDTIVVYDRIRENVAKYRDRKFPQVINASLNETLSRTILTSLTTLLSSLAMLFIGAGDVAVFAFVFSFGIIVGTYSSIAVASPVTLWLNDRFAQKAMR